MQRDDTSTNATPSSHAVLSPPEARDRDEPPIAGSISMGSGSLSSESKHEQLARSNLATFFKRGIDAEAWAIFDSPESFRVAYIGTPTSNLTHLVRLHNSAGQQSPRVVADTPGAPHRGSTAGVETVLDSGHQSDPGLSFAIHDVFGVGQYLHYPYPPIRPKRPWKPAFDEWGSSSGQDLASDLSCFPAPDVCDALVESYFRYIHPFSPIISKAEFLQAYRNPNQPPPLLLLQAVLMAGAHACQHPLVSSSRHSVKRILFRRASMLYHIRHETDRIHLMQAATIFTWHIGDGDSITGGPWYWAGIATRIGCGLGCHRRSASLPAAETSQYRRCMWSAFVCEVFACLESGRPCTLRAEDIDQSLLTQDDMGNSAAQRSTSDEAGDSTAAEHEHQDDPRNSLRYLNHMVELAYIGLDILSANAPSSHSPVDIGTLNSRLGLWSISSGSSTTGCDDSPATYHLRLHYNLILLHLHRNYTDEPSSKSVCSTAARNVMTTLEKLDSLGFLASCSFTAVSAVTAAGIQLVNEIREATMSRSSLVVIHALEELSRLMQTIVKLTAYWPNAEAVHDVFKGLHREYELHVQQHLRGEQVVVPESQLDWNRLFESAQAPQFNHTLVGQDWLNISNWWELY